MLSLLRRRGRGFTKSLSAISDEMQRQLTFESLGKGAIDMAQKICSNYLNSNVERCNIVAVTVEVNKIQVTE